MTMLRAFWDAALELDRPRPTRAGRCDTARPAELRELWEAAGLHEVETDELHVGADYADFEDY